MANRTKEPSEFGEHMKAAGRAMARQWKSLLPDDFWKYGREARRETLLALRSVVDGAIERLEGREAAAETARARTPRKAKIEVE